MIEIWVNIAGYPEYQISNLGRIMSYKKGGKIINGWLGKNGYYCVTLNNDKLYLHRLVAKTFIYKPEGKNVVNHKDGNKLNNSIENLEWCTNEENIQHAYKIGLMDNAIEKMRQKKIRAKRIAMFNKDAELIKVFKGSTEAEKYLKKQGIKVNARNIRYVCEGNRKTAGGFTWGYLD